MSQLCLPGIAAACRLEEGHVEQRKKLNEKSRRAYVEGMKRYQEQGVRVLIDGKDADDELWEKIFEVRKDGGFYMGDYILEDVSIPMKDVQKLPEALLRQRTLSQPDVVRDAQTEYGAGAGDEADTGSDPDADPGRKKKLKEIRFDIVYHR